MTTTTQDTQAQDTSVTEPSATTEATAESQEGAEASEEGDPWDIPLSVPDGEPPAKAEGEGEAATSATEDEPNAPTAEASEDANRVDEGEREARRRARLAAVKKETDLREREQKLKEAEEKQAAYNDAREKKDAIGAMQALGWDEDEILDSLATRAGSEEGEQAEEGRVAKELKQLKAQLEAEKAEKAEAEKKAKEQAAAQQVEQAKQSVEKQVKDAGEKYELMNALGRQDLVWDVAEAYYHENNGATLSFEQAAAAAEKALEQDLEAAAQTKKFKSKFQPSSQQSPKASNGKKSLSGNGAGGVAVHEDEDADLEGVLDPIERAHIISKRVRLTG